MHVRPPTLPRSIRHRIAPIAAIACTLLPTLLIGCVSAVPAPSASDAPFQGPPVSLTTDGVHHLAVVEAPSPGWSVSLTRELPGPGHRAAYITIKKPFPGVIYPQVIVTQRVSTRINLDQPVRVYARVLEHDAKPSSKAAYALAAQSSGVSPSPPATPPPASTTPSTPPPGTRQP